MKRYYQYADDIENGKVKACKMVKLAVKRFRNDIKNQEKEDFEYVFIEEYADKVIGFIEKLKHYEGEFANKPIILEPWQCFIIANLYGWRLKADHGARRFLKAFIYVARKNGKTLLMSALALYDILTEKGAQAYSGATRRDQAAISFDNVVQFVQNNKELSKLLKVYRSSIVFEPTASKFQALSSEAKKFDGLNPSLAIIDECAAQGSSVLVDVLQSGTYSRKSPLLLEITTGSFNMESVGYQEYKGSISILEGAAHDERYFCILYELDSKDKWTDESNYIKANPNLGVSLTMEKLLFARDEAIRMPYKEAEFRTKNLNQWMNANSSWISAQSWSKCATADFEVTEELLEDALAVGAVDLSKRNDITSYSLYFWLPEQRKYVAKHRFYIPEGQIEAKMRNESLRFREWIKRGYITAIPGEVVDYEYLYRDMREDFDAYRIAEVAYDDYNAVDLVRQIGPLTNLLNYPQNMKHMSPAAKDWEAAILKDMIYDPNPVMEWMLGCAVIYIDAGGNIKPKKDGDPASSKRIDGIITSIMAFDRLRAHVSGEIDASVTKDDLLAFFNLSY